ncbi:cyclic nucleotide-gated ion channel 1-like [Rosa rugosa]|uniref:cyclic nucleotide-gated ion channel 1-like n=1 Tax=Rosa rugosa TaxID=74645 RepID=UPI002B405F76|nr:cyclic nucleotide-gated ion channel 1-like [Rosa rugosa]
MSQSFWWALRNLSSLGSNLQTSLYTMEIFLSVMISISGMVLFLVYLNARVQEPQELLDQPKSKKMQLLKKVPVLENIPENILIAICEHLKPVTYTEDSYIVQEGRPLVKMLFIVEGLAWTYTTGNIDVGTLKRGDFYGEEVLTWAFQSPSFSGLPISTRTVISEGKIEAFALRAGDLKSVVCSFGGI